MGVFDRRSGSWVSHLLIVGALLLALLIVGPFFLSVKAPTSDGRIMRTVPSTHDLGSHYSALLEFDRAVREGHLYPRWQAGYNFGYGLPWLNYYSPGFYFAAEMVYLVLPRPLGAIFIVSLWLMAASGMACYAFVRHFCSPLPSAIAAAFYMLAPYHVLDLYQRGALPEFAGFVFVPLIFLFAFRSGTSGRLGDIAGLGISYGLYIFTHWPVSYLVTYALALYVVLWTLSERNWRIPLRVAAGMALGVAVSAIYWVPVLLEGKYIQEFWTATFPYATTYLPDRQPRDSFGTLLNQSFGAHVALMMAAITVWILYRRRPVDAATSMHTRCLLITGVVATLMVTQLSAPISQLIPRMAVVTFAWRWMVVVAFLAAIAVAVAIEKLRARPDESVLKRWACRVIVAVALLGNLWVTGYSIMRGGLGSAPMGFPTTHVEDLFFPQGAHPPRNLVHTPEAFLIAGQGNVEVLRWGALSRELLVSLESEGVLRLKSYNFPGWTGRMDGRPAEILSDQQGVQYMVLPPGNHKLQISFENTRPRIAGAVISGLALALAIGFIFVHSKRPAMALSGPTYDEMLHPEKLPAALRREALAAIGRDELNPIHLYNINWRDPQNRVRHVVLPQSLTGVDANIIVMLGCYFPSGSHKVGPAYATLMEGELAGEITPDRSTIIGPSTGNFGIGVAYIAKLKGYPAVVIMPEQMSAERYERIRHYDGKLDLTPGSESDVILVLQRTEEYKKDPSNKVLAQFELLPNYRFHRHVTGGSALEAASAHGNGRIAAFVAAPGSAGTLAAGDQIKAQFPDAVVCALEPRECSTLYNNGRGSHRIEGIGDKMVALIHNVLTTDYVALIHDGDCVRGLKAVQEGPWGLAGLFGVSGICNVLGSIKMAKYLGLGKDDNVVTIATDGFDRYPSVVATVAGDAPEVFSSADSSEILDVRSAAEKERLFRQKEEVWTKFNYSREYLDRMKSQDFWDAEYARIPEIDKAWITQR